MTTATQLTWTKTAEGYAAGDYRVLRRSDRYYDAYRLSASEVALPLNGKRLSATAARELCQEHADLAAEQAAAEEPTVPTCAQCERRNYEGNPEWTCRRCEDSSAEAERAEYDAEYTDSVGGEGVVHGGATATRITVEYAADSPAAQRQAMREAQEVSQRADAENAADEPDVCQDCGTDLTAKSRSVFADLCQSCYENEIDENLPADGGPMEPWRRCWREGFAPSLSTPGLEALRRALETDDPKLIQKATTWPPPLQCVQDWPVEAACVTGYCGWMGDGLGTVGDVEEFFARVCFEVDQRLGEPAGCRYLLNWYDDVPGDEMRALLLPEVRRELSRRAAGSAPVCDECEAPLRTEGENACGLCPRCDGAETADAATRFALEGAAADAGDPEISAAVESYLTTDDTTVLRMLGKGSLRRLRKALYRRGDTALARSLPHVRCAGGHDYARKRDAEIKIATETAPEKV